ncbi:hypothetical protein WN51_01465 [Melipona quadrifasciata]|uniref:Uncharacterized protein n=1 Tax=Melipona quadrifasciata TaxID=166423 RepID=A0A0M8ZY03_9HYME|nr:hypothetical protein WN51_01465 [Melipona quadrifasciata]
MQSVISETRQEQDVHPIQFLVNLSRDLIFPKVGTIYMMECSLRNILKINHHYNEILLITIILYQ